MNIELNGRARDDVATVAEAVAAVTAVPIDGSASVAELVRGVAVALNGEVVPHSEWGRDLAEGDTVEVLTATQGG